MARVTTHPWDAEKNGFWNANGGYERFRNRAEWEQRTGYQRSKAPYHLGYRWCKQLGCIPMYREGVKYSKVELELMADDLIFADEGWVPDGTILNPEMYKRRKKHEIMCNQTPDPSIVSGLYWRTHPQGLRWNPREERIEKSLPFYND